MNDGSNTDRTDGQLIFDRHNQMIALGHIGTWKTVSKECIIANFGEIDHLFKMNRDGSEGVLV